MWCYNWFSVHFYQPHATWKFIKGVICERKKSEIALWKHRVARAIAKTTELAGILQLYCYAPRSASPYYVEVRQMWAFKWYVVR
jgi:hypothetical protein